MLPLPPDPHELIGTVEVARMLRMNRRDVQAGKGWASEVVWVCRQPKLAARWQVEEVLRGKIEAARRKPEPRRKGLVRRKPRQT